MSIRQPYICTLFYPIQTSLFLFSEVKSLSPSLSNSRDLEGVEKEKSVRMASRCEILCEILLAIFLPPLGVCLRHGCCTVEFFICLVLTILGYVPGIIYALYAIVFIDRDRHVCQGSSISLYSSDMIRQHRHSRREPLKINDLSNVIHRQFWVPEASPQAAVLNSGPSRGGLTHGTVWTSKSVHPDRRTSK
ncbi:low temperature and salt responsive protein family, partial [Striga asiatica]